MSGLWIGRQADDSSFEEMSGGRNRTGVHGLQAAAPDLPGGTRQHSVVDSKPELIATIALQCCRLLPTVDHQWTSDSGNCAKRRIPAAGRPAHIASRLIRSYPKPAPFGLPSEIWICL